MSDRRPHVASSREQQAESKPGTTQGRYSPRDVRFICRLVVNLGGG